MSTRLVLESGASVSVRFWTSDFPAPFGGQREMVQRVHDSYPAYFRPNPAVLPSIWGASAQYWMSGLDRRKLPGGEPLELMRRLYATWEWSYAPFKRAGDHLVREEYWNYQPLLAFDKQHSNLLATGTFSFANLKRDDFLKIRENYFNAYQGAFGFMFYSPLGSWMEKQLAEDKHADAIIRDPNHKHDLKYYVTGYDEELLVMPWFTSVQQTLESDFRTLASELDFHGFGLDVALGGPRYRGPGVAQKEVPIAYDEEGEFLDAGVGAAKLIDYIHTLSPRFAPENRLAAVINGTRSFSTAVRGDSGMLEGTPYFQGREQIPLSRFLAGQKPLTWWKGWSYSQFAVPNWQQFGRDHFLKTMKGLVDYVIFSSFEWGNLPTVPYELGVPKVVHYMPLLIDSSHRGWQAVFPVKFAFDGQVQTGRFGRGCMTRLFWGNPYEEARSIQASVDNDYLDKGAVIFASAANGPQVLQNTLAGDETRFAVDVPSRQPLILDAVATVPRETVAQAKATLQSSLYARSIKIALIGKSSAQIQVTLPDFPGFTLDVATYNGAALAPKRQKEAYVVEVPVSDKEGVLEVKYTSSTLHFAEKDLQDFKFFTDQGDAAFQYTCEPAGALDSLALLDRMQGYFRFYARVAMKNDKPAAAAVANSGAGRLIFQIDPKLIQGAITFEEGNFLFRAASAQELSGELNAFFRALDERYPYVPGFVATWGMDGSLLRHVDMSGKLLEP